MPGRRTVHDFHVEFGASHNFPLFRSLLVILHILAVIKITACALICAFSGDGVYSTSLIPLPVSFGLDITSQLSSTT